jgi:starvation-inducible DNA-binding protein
MSNSALNLAPKETALKTGILKTDTKLVAEAVADALADSFTLYLKTLGVHWNVVGASFYGLHKLTQAQYEDLDAAIDAMAERIRALGHLAPASFGDFAKRSVIKSESTIATADEMINELVARGSQNCRRS